MRTQPRNMLFLAAVIALAVLLTVAVSGGVMARSTFQSSVQLPTDTPMPVPTFPPPAAPQPGVPPVQPTTAPIPQPNPTGAAIGITPTVPGYLPPPTLTNPDALVPGRSSSLSPNGQAPLSAPAVSTPEATPVPDVPAEVPSVARLIDNGVVALSYVWLCCGALGLVGAAFVLIWLARRSKRR